MTPKNQRTGLVRKLFFLLLLFLITVLGTVRYGTGPESARRTVAVYMFLTVPVLIRLGLPTKKNISFFPFLSYNGTGYWLLVRVRTSLDKKILFFLFYSMTVLRTSLDKKISFFLLFPDDGTRYGTDPDSA
jgi:hypothetical protein